MPCTIAPPSRPPIRLGQPLLLSLAVLSRPTAALRVPPQPGLKIQANAADGGTGTLRVVDALHDISSKYPGSSTCITASGAFMGRLSNTVSMLNPLARIAVNTSRNFNASISLVFPQNYTAWMKKESLHTLFSGEPVCATQAVNVYHAHCPPFVPYHPNRCETVDMLLDTAADDKSDTTLCNCDRIVYMPTETMLWDHKYEWTHGLFRKRYWDVHEPTMRVPGTELSTPGSMPVQAVMHVRLGDIESGCEQRFTRYNCNKKLKADYYVSTVQALLAVLPARCTELGIVTDGHLNSPDIVHVREGLKDSGLSALRVWTSGDLDTVSSFNLMIHADVLIFGSSGFGQLAAVLAKPETARLGNPLPRGHPQRPFFFLPNTTQLFATEGGNFSMSQAIEAVRTNPAIQALADACGRRA